MTAVPPNPAFVLTMALGASAVAFVSTIIYLNGEAWLTDTFHSMGIEVK